MSLQLPSYPDPTNTSPITNAYAWIAQINLDFVAGSGRVVVWVNRDAASAAAGLPPVATLGFALGEVVVPASGSAPAVTFPTLAQLLTSAATIQAATPANAPFDSFRQAVYQALMTLPQFAGATEVA